MKKMYLFMLIFGILGMLGSVFFLIYTYIKSASVNNMITPLILTFVPFVVSFELIIFSSKRFGNKK